MMAQDIFSEINNAISDLQTSTLQTYERPLKKIAQLLRHSDLEPYNTELKAGLDFEAFIKKSEQTKMGARTAKLLWPEDCKQTLGLTLLLIEKLAADHAYIVRFSYDFFETDRNIMININGLIKQLVTPFLRDYKNYVQSKGDTRIELKIPLSRKVFIVHGHDNGAREAVARFLERIGLKAIILHEQANQGQTVIEKVVAHSNVGFAVILLTPDDEGRTKGSGALESRPRQNVLLELGYFIGRLGREKVCALKRGALEIPSDFAGVVWETMEDNNNGWKLALARELTAAGYNDIDWNKVMDA